MLQFGILLSDLYGGATQRWRPRRAWGSLLHEESRIESTGPRPPTPLLSPLEETPHTRLQRTSVWPRGPVLTRVGPPSLADNQRAPTRSHTRTADYTPHHSTARPARRGGGSARPLPLLPNRHAPPPPICPPTLPPVPTVTMRRYSAALAS